MALRQVLENIEKKKSQIKTMNRLKETSSTQNLKLKISKTIEKLQGELFLLEMEKRNNHDKCKWETIN